MPQQTRTTLRHSQNPAVHPICNDIDSSMGLPEQTRLQPRLHHVEWARNNGSGHATNPGKNGATKGVRIQTFSTNKSKTHAPPTKCCQDFAGTHFGCAVSDIGLSVTVAREGGRFVGHVTRTLISDGRVVPWEATRSARGLLNRKAEQW